MTNKWNLKNIILSSIGILSAIILLISMFFYYTHMPILKNSIVEGLLSINGFSVLDFKVAGFNDYNVDILVFIMAIGGYLMLISAIFSLTFSIIALLKNRRIKWPLILNIIAAGFYMLVGIGSTLILNDEVINELGKDAAEIIKKYQIPLFGTSAFWALIFQTMLITAYFISLKFIKDSEKEYPSERKFVSATSLKYISYGQNEKDIISVIKQYKELYSKGIINIMEFKKKKYELMFKGRRIDAKAEMDIAEAIMEYKKIYEEEIITFNEFEKKKAQLLDV